MATRIETKIVGYKVRMPEPEQGMIESQQSAEIIQMHEKVERPETLYGCTYKIKTPLSEHALYVTINDIVLNEGTEHELRRPFEIFINSKNMDHFQWIVALTRIISAVFRKGGDITFLVEELRSVFDPQSGYFKKGRYVPSLVAEIGNIIERHLIGIGLLQPAELAPERQRYVADKRREYEVRHGARRSPARTAGGGDVFPDSAALCSLCQTKAVILLDGCMTCLNCGESRCG